MGMCDRHGEWTREANFTITINLTVYLNDKFKFTIDSKAEFVLKIR